MAENRRRYPCYLHISLCLLSTILGSFGVVGYLRYGDETSQIVTENLQGSVIVVILRCLLFFGVLFTYPLQIYPIIQIVEGIFFGPNSVFSRKLYRRGPTINGNSEDSSFGNLISDGEHEIPAVVKVTSAGLKKKLNFCCFEHSHFSRKQISFHCNGKFSEEFFCFVSPGACVEEQHSASCSCAYDCYDCSGI